MRENTRTPRFRLTSAGLATAALVAAHLLAVRTPSTRGIILVLDHLFNVSIAFGLLALCTAIGQGLTRRLGIAHDSAIEALVFSAALGAGVLATAILALGAAGGFHARYLSLLLGGACILTRTNLAALPQQAIAATRELRKSAGRPALVVFALVAAVMIVLAVAPPTDWDSLMYHIQIPAQFLERGAIHVPEDNLHVSYVGLFHMLYVPLIAFGAPAACSLLNVFMTLALAAVLLTAGSRLFSPPTGRLAIVLLWGSPVLILAGATARVDVVLACYLFLGHYAMLRAWQSRKNFRPWIVVSGLLLGFAVGVKFLALPYIAVLLPLLFAVAFTNGSRNLRESWLALAMFGIVLVVAAAPWLVKNWMLLGSPLYPHFADRILPPWLAQIHGSNHVPSSIDPQSLRALRAVRAPFNLSDWFLAPGRLTPESEGSAYGGNWIFLTLGLVPFFVRRRIMLAVIAPGIFFVLLILWRGTYINLRYLIPAYASFTLAAAFILAQASAAVRLHRLRAASLVTICAVALLPAVHMTVETLSANSAVSHAAGLVSRDSYRLESRNGQIGWYARTVAAVNALTTSDARILLLFEARGYEFAAPTLQDNNLMNWPLLSPVALQRVCDSAPSMTHVFVANGALDYYMRRGLDPKMIGWQDFTRFAQRCLESVGMGPGWELYRVK